MSLGKSVLTAIAVGVIASSAMAQSTMERPVHETTRYRVDSGAKSNARADSSIVFSHVVGVEDTLSTRVMFEDVALPAGSLLRVTSLLDGDQQIFDQQMIRTWNLSTAYFNGDAVLVELVAGAETEGNRVAISEVQYEPVTAGEGRYACGVCDGDDRTPSDEDWACRLFPAGCSASIYNQESCVVTAGHCVGGNMVVQFRVPDSFSNCAPRNPPTSEQFPITASQWRNDGVGFDWGALKAGENTLGQTPYERYGVFRPVATSSSPGFNDPIDIWGYGSDNQCTRSQTQQFGPGVIVGWDSRAIAHTSDTTGGNSGSGVLRDGEIIGIATHCGCFVGGDSNIAQRVDTSDFVQARADVCNLGSCCMPDGTCLNGVQDTTCADMGGLYQGDGADCTPNFCPGETVACCLPDGTCEQMQIGPCQTSGGAPQGFFSCSGVDCPVTETCPADLSGDDLVDSSDLFELLGAWGDCPGCDADMTGDNVVDSSDLFELLGAWGDC